MADKRQILKESAKKLISLNIPEKEIIINLRDVGVSEAEAKSILEETRAELTGERYAPEEEERAPEEQLEEAFREVEMEKAKPSRREAFSARGPSKEVSEASPSEISRLWQKGILATVEAKLGEMEKIKKDIDSVMDAKVQEATAREVRKIEALMDAQRTLTLNKVETGLEQKAKELTTLIQGRISELREASQLASENIKRLEAQKESNERLLDSISEKIDSLEKVKSGLISDMNASLIKSQSRVESFLKESEKKSAEMEARINRTLQLQSKITDGLLSDAQQKIDRMALQKSDELVADIYAVIKNAKQAAHEISSKLDELEKLKGGINDTKQDLELFKQQFISMIEKNVEQFNKARAEMARHMSKRDEAIEKRIQAIDLKMAELTEFERNFAKEMGVVIEKYSAQKEDKKAKVKDKN